MEKENQTRFLQFTDIIILSLIFFGDATITSLYSYFDTLQSGAIVTGEDALVFSDSDNYNSIVIELISLTVAWLYLRWRQFDFGVLNFSTNRLTIPLTLLLIVCAGLIADVYQYFHSTILPHHYPEISDTIPLEKEWGSFSLLLLAFALLNGFYEELFFLGLVYAVPPKNLPYILPFSLLVRFAFHTYQGLAGAATVTVLGVVYLLFRRKINTLLPFMLAHAFFDIFGLGILQTVWILYN